MQRCGGGVVDLAIDGEPDVFEFKGLGAGFDCVCLEVLGGPHEPVEGDTDELDGVSIEHPEGWVVSVKGFGECAENGSVDGVGAQGRVVLVGHGLVERRE